MPVADHALPELSPITTEATATLPMSAGRAYEAFADAISTPRWLPILQSARVLERTLAGLPTAVAFVGRLERGSIAYMLRYQYDPTSLAISWATGHDAAVQISGEARFVALSASACLINYRLSCDLPVSVPWIDSTFEQHAASAVVSAFREHLRAA